MTSGVVVHIDRTPAARSKAAARGILKLARACAPQGRFTLALSGGSTPKKAYELLASPAFRTKMPWAQTLIFFGDERCVPHGHADSNFRLAYEAFLKRVPIPRKNVFPVSTEDTPARCAVTYEKTLRRELPLAKNGFPVFDLILLGVGADGHTASLLPGTAAVDERRRWVTWADPQAATSFVTPAMKRITITPPVIWNARNVFVLATGSEKAPVVAGILSARRPANPPVARLLRRCRGRVVFFLDRAAAKGIR